MRQKDEVAPISIISPPCLLSSKQPKSGGMQCFWCVQYLVKWCPVTRVLVAVWSILLERFPYCVILKPPYVSCTAEFRTPDAIQDYSLEIESRGPQKVGQYVNGQNPAKNVQIPPAPWQQNTSSVYEETSDFDSFCISCITVVGAHCSGSGSIAEQLCGIQNFCKVTHLHHYVLISSRPTIFPSRIFFAS